MLTCIVRTFQISVFLLSCDLLVNSNPRAACLISFFIHYSALA